MIGKMNMRFESMTYFCNSGKLSHPVCLTLRIAPTKNASIAAKAVFCCADEHSAHNREPQEKDHSSDGQTPDTDPAGDRQRNGAGLFSAHNERRHVAADSGAGHWHRRWVER
jgi:hypothetical protein